MGPAPQWGVGWVEGAPDRVREMSLRSSWSGALTRGQVKWMAVEMKGPAEGHRGTEG